jgi:hypothetical protein
MAAIHLVNEYLNDPLKAVSDEAFSAVLRLLTFEVRYFPPSIIEPFSPFVD